MAPVKVSGPHERGVPEWLVGIRQDLKTLTEEQRALERQIQKLIYKTAEMKHLTTKAVAPQNRSKVWTVVVLLLVILVLGLSIWMSKI